MAKKPLLPKPTPLLGRAEFEAALQRRLTTHVQTDDALAAALWQALAGVEWQHKLGGAVAYSYKGAADLVVKLRNGGDYRQWYCCAPKAVVHETIAAELARDDWA